MRICLRLCVIMHGCIYVCTCMQAWSFMIRVHPVIICPCMNVLCMCHWLWHILSCVYSWILWEQHVSDARSKRTHTWSHTHTCTHNHAHAVEDTCSYVCRYGLYLWCIYIMCVYVYIYIILTHHSRPDTLMRANLYACMYVCMCVTPYCCLVNMSHLHLLFLHKSCKYVVMIVSCNVSQVCCINHCKVCFYYLFYRARGTATFHVNKMHEIEVTKV